MRYAQSIDDYFNFITKVLKSIDINDIDGAIKIIIDAYHSDSVIYIFGNGGSATTAEHLTCDFNKGLFDGSTKRFNMVCLNSNLATLTAYANDCGYENIFVDQLKGRLKKGDILICISGSGNSANVVNAARYAKDCGNTVITMTGYSGGKLKEISDCPIHIPVNDQQKTEDCHLMIGHLIAQIVWKEIGHSL